MGVASEKFMATLAKNEGVYTASHHYSLDLLSLVDDEEMNAFE